MPSESQSPRESRDGHISVREAAEILGIPRSTAYRHAQEMGRKVLGKWRIDPQLVDQILTEGTR